MKQFILSVKFAAIVGLISFFPNASAFAQFFDDVSLSFGLSQSWILGVQKAKRPFVPLKRDEDFAIEGGSFDNSQTGFDIRANITVDNKKLWRIPIGIDYSFYSAKERVPEGTSVKQYFTHEVNIAQFYTGIHYVFYKMAFAKAKAWIGPEFRASYVHSANYRFEIDYLNYDIMDDTITGKKPNALRIGPSLRLGIDGEIGNGLSVNINTHYTYLNMIGKDDTRSELLTPAYFEHKERQVHVFGLSFMLQFEL